LQYNFTDDVMTYFNYARGYKGPAFNVFFNMSANDTLPIAAETADTFEVGFKSTLFDRRLALNVAAFLAEYDNFQANSFRVISGSVVTSLTNAGTVKTTGIDADFNARITENFSLSGGMALADAEIKEFFCPPPGPGVPACSTRKGERLPLAPKWKHSLSADFTAPLGDMPYTAFANVLYSYQSHQFSSLGAFAAERIPGYGLVNVNLGLTDADERYRLTFSVRNLFDKSFPALITPGGQGGAFRYIIPRDADRHFGVTLKASF
jgi:iron complex outermembrane receptor protein